MLECRACLRRYVYAIVSTHSTRPRTLQTSARSFASAALRDPQTEKKEDVSTSTFDRRGRRHQQTTSEFRQQKPNQPEGYGPRPRRLNIWRVAAGTADKANEDGDSARAKTWENSRQAKEQRRQMNATQSSPKTEQSPSEKLLEKQLRVELQYLQDPVKLADHIALLLKRDQVDKALALTRMSSKALANTVSWNHIIDWHMKNSKTKAALEVYNEMKKRAQKPDSYTYMIILRGLAEYAHHPHSLGRALALYHAMSAPGNKVVPTVMHTNAVLKVCARAEALDSMWDIVSKMPESGPHAPDGLTYTTVLNAMRVNILKSMPSELEEERLRRAETTIVEGRRLWVNIVRRWRAGDLKLDGRLVYSMGQLLLSGARPRDWDDVLSLIEQTMDIPRLVPRLGTVARQEAGLPRIRAPNTPDDLKNDNSEVRTAYDEKHRPGSEFDSLKSPITASTSSTAPARRKPGQLYVQPDQRTISLVLQACLKTVAKRAATQYFELFTTAHDIGPDLDNMHVLLRVLRQSKSSSEAVKLVTDDLPHHDLKPEPKTFRIAMSACFRDTNNAKRADNAGTLFDAMALRGVLLVDAPTLTQYIDTASSTEDPAAMALALERLYKPALNLVPKLRKADAQSQALHRDGLVVLLRHMISCCDRVRENARLDDDDKKRQFTRWSKELGSLVDRVRKDAIRGPPGLNEDDDGEGAGEDGVPLRKVEYARRRSSRAGERASVGMDTG